MIRLLPRPWQRAIDKRISHLPAVRAVRRSLALRMGLTALALGVVLVVGLLVFVTGRIRSDVFSDRLNIVLDDASMRVATAQSQFDASTATTADEVAFLAQSQLTQMKSSSSGAGGVGVVLVRSSQETSPTLINDLTTSTALRTLISADLAKKVEEAGPGHQYWQSIAVPTPDGDDTRGPGIVVGTQIILPQAGVHDLYIFYTLQPEQRTLDLAARAVSIGSMVVLVLLVLGVWGLTWRVLLPVRQTSLAAQRVASGHLSERLTVRGEDELASLAMSFNNMAASIEAQIDRLAELSRLQQRFVSDVSHELRTPLTTIRLAGEQLFDARDDFDDPILKRSAELLSEQIERFDRMLSDLLEMSRFDAGAANLAVRNTDVLDVLNHVVAMAGPLAATKGSDIRLTVPDYPCMAEIDPRRVERILRNLVVNALEHGEGNPLDIEMAANNTAVAVRVRDHGIGMSPQVAEHVFDRFYRADPARARTTGGTGLGLSISLEDASLHNGTLNAWGWPGDGASFLLVLPVTQSVPIDIPPLDVIPDDAPPLAKFATEPELADPDDAPAVPMTPPLGIPVPVPATRWADETGSVPAVASTADAAAEDEDDN
ncbi:MtrAB system histidine kinase MtrB [Actinomyces vulturis]|uniref:MtrAB system histidine kinase MtrB n=1 Tax=Actinomyces vulturis TaxID=1857645 RepID=UPI0008379826|nr:MtrAB system histidine kinase MtrB [Actinomyces vulturis]